MSKWQFKGGSKPPKQFAQSKLVNKSNRLEYDIPRLKRSNTEISNPVPVKKFKKQALNLDFSIAQNMQSISTAVLAQSGQDAVLSNSFEALLKSFPAKVDPSIFSDEANLQRQIARDNQQNRKGGKLLKSRLHWHSAPPSMRISKLPISAYPEWIDTSSLILKRLGLSKSHPNPFNSTYNQTFGHMPSTSVKVKKHFY